jgi:hypothetical protein
LFNVGSHALKKFATLFLTASMAIGSVLTVSAPASAAPIAQIAVVHASDVVQVRDERYWRHHRDDRRNWHGDRRDWHRGRGDWRRDRWRHDRNWDRHHRRHGVVIRF